MTNEFGSDGQLHEQPAIEHKGSFLTEHAPAGAPADPFAASEPGAAAQREELEPDSAAARLRAFEDEHLGPDAPRFGNSVEKGHGSLFARLPPEKQKAHALIEKTAETEQKLADARTKLAIAENEHNTAVKQAEMAMGREDASRLGSG